MNEREIIAKEWRDDNGILHRREVGQELVRCKECGHYVMFGAGYECERGLPNMTEDDFCSYGEVRDE